MTAKKPAENALQPPNAVALGRAILNAYEKAQPLFEEYATKYSSPETYKEMMSFNFDPMNVKHAYIDFLKQITKDPQSILELQSDFMEDWYEVWQKSIAKFMQQDDGQLNTRMQLKSDKRFRAPEWEEVAIFDFMKNSYLLVSGYVDKSIRTSEGLDNKQKEKLSFYTRMFTDAMSPTNFAMTNPDVLKETLRTGGENLINGFTNILGDLTRGKGDLNISMTQYDKFTLGENLAVTPGRVVFQNEMFQLIQYEPKTKNVLKTPMLVVPPWINKYYILDLCPGKSYVEWMVEQGHSVFLMSWVNPDESYADKTFSNYIHDGVITAIDQVQKITKEDKINTMSYCIGGTLLMTALAYISETRKDVPVASATCLTTLLDFENAGDLLLFLDKPQIANLERKMAKTGYLDGACLKKTFSALRANDLTWSFVVNNYLMGKEPFPFDLLYWNDDPTNMPREMHSFYLNNMYSKNKLIEPGGISIDGVDIDLSKVKVPCHFISTIDDHIAPWAATYEGSQYLGGDITFTLAGSGHIAGIINPPAKKKYGYWTNAKNTKSPDEWLKNATESKGSWWPNWQKWVEKFSDGKVTARKVAKGIEAAPGSYVTAEKAGD
ncbi:MAG: class I poly(R)-hydroxyalkanoic acid synthase [Alphaproteobacteria bacterium]|nr:class I poly(R)-hydroxyalkanoic acid synthase [Alphaproteobacteria bacterium]